MSVYPVSNHCCNLTVFFFSPVPPFSPEIMGVMSGEIGSVVKGENIYFSFLFKSEQPDWCVY